MSSNFVGSFIQASRSKKNIEQSFKNHKQQSNIIKKSTSTHRIVGNKNKYQPTGLATIAEEPISNNKPQPKPKPSTSKDKLAPIHQPSPKKDISDNNSLASKNDSAEHLH